MRFWVGGTRNWDQASGQFSLQKPDGTYRSWFGVFFAPFPREQAIGRESAGTREVV